MQHDRIMVGWNAELFNDMKKKSIAEWYEVQRYVLLGDDS